MTTTDEPEILAFSGGGFRATLFHLGVVKALSEAKKLDKVQHVVGVSGGAILAAHLVANWECYKASPDCAAKDLVRFARRDLRSAAFRRLPSSAIAFAAIPAFWLLGKLSQAFLGRSPATLPRVAGFRAQHMARSYDLLFRRYRDHHGKRRRRRRSIGSRVLIDDLRDNGAPQLHVLATELTNGQLCAITQEHIRTYGFADTFSRYPVWTKERARTAKENLVRRGALRPDLDLAFNCPVGLALAASSCFPVVFRPILASKDTLSQSLDREMVLADGGMFDNSALTYAMFLAMSAQVQSTPDQLPSGACAIMCSDASAPFAHEAASSFVRGLGRMGLNTVTRAIDIGMRHQVEAALSSYMFMDDNEGSRPITTIRVAIDHVVKPDGCPITSLNPETRALLASMRTDLDRFARYEAASLQAHGFDASNRALAAAGTESKINSDSIKVFDAALEKHRHSIVHGLRNESRRLRPRLIAFDGWTLVNATLIVPAVALIVMIVAKEADRRSIDAIVAGFQMIAYQNTQQTDKWNISIHQPETKPFLQPTATATNVAPLWNGTINMTVKGASKDELYGYGPLTRDDNSTHDNVNRPKELAIHFIKSSNSNAPNLKSRPKDIMFPISVDVGIGAAPTEAGFLRDALLRCALLKKEGDDKFSGWLYWYDRRVGVPWIDDHIAGPCSGSFCPATHWPYAAYDWIMRQRVELVRSPKTDSK